MTLPEWVLTALYSLGGAGQVLRVPWRDRFVFTSRLPRPTEPDRMCTSRAVGSMLCGFSVFVFWPAYRWLEHRAPKLTEDERQRLLNQDAQEDEKQAKGQRGGSPDGSGPIP